MTRFHALRTLLTGIPPEEKTPPDEGGAHTEKDTNHMLLDAISTDKARLAPPEGSWPLQLLIKEGRLHVPRALAAQILEEARYERQRRLRPDQLKLLSSKMLRRTFNASSTLSFGLLGGQLILLNGYHRLTAIVETGLAQDFHIAIEPVETESAMHALYWTFDRGVAARSSHDVLDAAGVAASAGITKTTAAAVYNAVPLIMNKFQRPRYQTDPVSARDDDARLAVAQQWWAAAAEYEGLIDKSFGALRQKLHNAQVVAVALVTLKHQPEHAEAFWGGLAANDGLRIGDPRKALIDTMFGDNHWGGTRLAGLTGVAWNKWLAGDKARLLRFFADKASVTIDGTPFGKRGI